MSVLGSGNDKLGELIARDNYLVNKFGFHEFVRRRRARGHFASMAKVKHPARRLLRRYAKQGVPVVLAAPPWTADQLQAAIDRGPHKSAFEHHEFLREEMADMIQAGHWTVLPWSVAKHLPGLRLSPIGVVPQHDRRPRTIVDYTYFGINAATQPVTPKDAMQFGETPERIIRQIVLADPSYGPVEMIKVDIADGFYRVWLHDQDIAKLGVVFPNNPGEEPLVAFPLALPMGWANSPPSFCAATETVADIANDSILKWRDPPPHRLEEVADTPPETDVRPALLPLPSHVATPVPETRDPALLGIARRQLAAIDLFVDDFIGLGQGSRQRLNRIRRILLTALDQVLRPVDNQDSPAHKEPASVKKLRQGDACWNTCKKVLGWIIDTVSLTVTLPERRARRLAEILSEIPRTQRRISVQKWHRLMGELRSMSMALPGARGFFGVLQEAFRHVDKGRVRLTPDIHAQLDDFRQIADEIPVRPMRLTELVPLTPAVVGSHDAAGHGAGGVILPYNSPTPRAIRLRSARSGQTDKDAPVSSTHKVQGTSSSASPIVWRMPFPKHITDKLVTDKNPNGTLTNSDLELAGSVLHLEATAQCFDIRERTTKNDTDNTPTLFWQRKGSTTSTKANSTILRMQSWHQRYHRYIKLHDYLDGPRNKMADDASRLQHLSNTEFLQHFDSHYPQQKPWRLWTPPREIVSSIIGGLLNEPLQKELWLRDPKPPISIGSSGPSSAEIWPSTPYSPKLKIPLRSFKSSSTDTESANWPPVVSASDLAQWKMPYGVLRKRSRVWGPGIHASRPKGKWISGSTASSDVMQGKIPHLTE
jgi:hypothetical protein